MMAGAVARAASQNGVAPTSSGLKFQSRDERRVGVQFETGAFGSAPCASSAADHFLVAAHDRRVQRGEARRRRRSGRRPCRAGTRRGPAKPACAASAVALTPQASASFDVRAGRDEQLRRCEIADARREHQRRVAAVRNRPVVFEAGRAASTAITSLHIVRPRVDVGTVRDEHLDDVGMLLRDGPHQRGLPARRADVDLGALRQQLFDDLGVARVRAATISGVSPASSARFGFGARLQQPPNHRRAAVLSSPSRAAWRRDRWRRYLRAGASAAAPRLSRSSR